ncbi:hypothetical protein GPJ56_007223 [Histomonas meleagridis]|nr:hypothetical protein GPJ56_007223 [Histomonas meleagridis]
MVVVVETQVVVSTRWWWRPGRHAGWWCRDAQVRSRWAGESQAVRPGVEHQVSTQCSSDAQVVVVKYEAVVVCDSVVVWRLRQVVALRRAGTPGASGTQVRRAPVQWRPEASAITRCSEHPGCSEDEAGETRQVSTRRGGQCSGTLGVVAPRWCATQVCGRLSSAVRPQAVETQGSSEHPGAVVETQAAGAGQVCRHPGCVVRLRRVELRCVARRQVWRSGVRRTGGGGGAAAWQPRQWCIIQAGGLTRWST